MWPSGCMRPAKEFSAVRKYFGETSTFELPSPGLIFAMQYQKLSPQLNYESYSNHTNVQYKSFICFRVQQFIHCYVIIIQNSWFVAVSVLHSAVYEEPGPSRANRGPGSHDKMGTSMTSLLT